MGLQSRTRLITCILTSGRKHTLSSQGPPWGRCKMCMCWGFQGSKQSRCCWHTQMKTYVTREIREDCLEEAVPKPGPNLPGGSVSERFPGRVSHRDASGVGRVSLGRTLLSLLVP